jgi:hypothetical protein
MDLNEARKVLSEKQAVHDRIASELDNLRAALAVVVEVTRDAQREAREKSVDAVLMGTEEAKTVAAEAKASLAAAFERETTLKDQIPTLDHALTRVSPELRSLREAIRQEEEARVLAAIREVASPALEQLRDAAARLLVVHWRGQPAQSGQIDLGRFLEDKAGALTVFRRAEEFLRVLRAQAIGEVQP